ncbi:MAG: hypothetical protein JWQ33_920 [Ramlibacter sp.]|nr:hypothetical protein [Ramlibacter sp.]
MTKSRNPEADETRAGYRSGEGAESVMRQLMSAARRRKSKAGLPDSYLPTRPSEDGDSVIDIQLPP